MLESLLEKYDFGFMDGGSYIFAQALQEILKDNDKKSELIIFGRDLTDYYVGLKVIVKKDSSVEFLSAIGCRTEFYFKRELMELEMPPGTKYNQLRIRNFEEADARHNIIDEKLSMKIAAEIQAKHKINLDALLDALQ